MLWGNDEITRLNRVVPTTMNLIGCIKSRFSCSNLRGQPLSIRQAVHNMLKHDWTILLFYQSCSIMLTILLRTWLLSQQRSNSLRYFYACTWGYRYNLSYPQTTVDLYNNNFKFINRHFLKVQWRSYNNFCNYFKISKVQIHKARGDFQIASSQCHWMYGWSCYLMSSAVKFF